MNLIKSIKHAGLTIEIYQDPDPQNPRDWSNLGVMYCRHRRYDLGDRGVEPPPGDSLKLPLYLYDHSGITISTEPFSCPWDSGQVGWIYCTRSAIFAEYGDCGEAAMVKAIQVMEAEVKVYDQYLQDQCWGFEIKDDEVEVLDSLWGIYQDEPPDHPDGYLMHEATEMANAMAEENGMVERETQLAEVWP